MIDGPANPISPLPGNVVVAASDGLPFLSNTTIAKDARSIDIANARLAALKPLRKTWP